MHKRLQHFKYLFILKEKESQAGSVELSAELDLTNYEIMTQMSRNQESDV